MANKFYCSKCGIELNHIRKAVKGRGYILDLIDPHECEGYAIIEADDGSKTVLEILNELKPLGRASLASTDKEDRTRKTIEPGDRRNDKSIRTSIAPPNILDSIKSMNVTEGVEDDLDEE
jgi:hypothetical protein